MDTGSVDFSHPMELQLHHRAPVKIVYHAEITGDEIHITQEEKDKTGFTEFIKLTGIYKYKQTDQKPPVINRTLALYRVENLPGNAKKAGFDPRKVVETTMDTYEDGAYDKTQSWRIELFTELLPGCPERKGNFQVNRVWAVAHCKGRRSLRRGDSEISLSGN